MIWVLIAVAGLIAWLSLAAVFLAVCHMAGQADKLIAAGRVRDGCVSVRDGDVIELRAVARSRRSVARGPGAPAAAAYLRSRDSRRSLSSLPSV